MSLPGIFRAFNRATWRRLTVAFAVFVLPVVVFVELAEEVREQATLGFDEAVLRAVNSVASPWLDAVAAGATQLGGVVGVVVLTLGMCVLLWQRARRRDASLLATGVGGAVLLNLLLKAIFQRDRPALWERVVTENSYSFPSGHAMASSALAVSLIVVAWPTRWRWPVTVGALSYVVVIAFTRLYLGVHYPTDIVAGWAVSAAWVAIVVAIIRYRTRALAWFARRKQ